ncbi:MULTISPECIES: DNA cytosine methyltransferase [unclassified Sphingopyxis]|uniref:DNA cytosine methyltransferase n=1 Tax=unclassified Sphingopyxis TaxID=2614943 RepID=UPI0009EACF3D|nr:MULTISPECIES: DNA cytosine methyltransferase [unclassified Sphingopyxis]
MGTQTFIDLFAGCGGLSLGLRRAGWTSLFAVEAHPDAFATYSHNLIREAGAWPEWLPHEAMRIEQLISDHRRNLKKLRGHVDLVAGGPPCQGFSTAGRRRADDPRNRMVRHYLDFLRLVEPRLVLLENVRGFMTMQLDDAGSYAAHVTKELEGMGYRVWSEMLVASQWGVPQRRPRFFVVASRDKGLEGIDPFLRMRVGRRQFLESRGLPIDKEVGVAEAIGDLKTRGATLVPYRGGDGGFMEIDYAVPPAATGYLALMRNGASGSPTGLRLPRHSRIVTERFNKILKTCRSGVPLSSEDRSRLGMQKRSLTLLAADKPSCTVTTLPDDMVHYQEPRILTVRECARLQSFPDSFEFLGPYTTGGDRRREACPRYTQVGNAVPPLLGEAIGEVLLALGSLAQNGGDRSEVVEMA